jgi:hypothetical protein
LAIGKEENGVWSRNENNDKWNHFASGTTPLTKTLVTYPSFSGYGVPSAFLFTQYETGTYWEHFRRMKLLQIAFGVNISLRAATFCPAWDSTTAGGVL